MPERGHPSPYEAVLGDGLAALHPRLATYFAAIPDGHHGRGTGVFTRVGTPRRWLWPVYWLLQRHGVLFPGWHLDVPFQVINTPAGDARSGPVVHAIRRFDFRGGSRDMVDAITAVPNVHGPLLVDFIGRTRLIECSLGVEVADGELRMCSTALALRVAGIRIRIPKAVAPRVSLIERFDPHTNAQHVALELSAPAIGRLYEYQGSFVYEIRAGVGEQ